MREKERARVIEQEKIASDVYSMWVETKAAESAIAGQFVSVYCKDPARLLPRPISICEVEDGKIRLVYRVVGKGTEEMATYKAGDEISLIGPLGNGFSKRDKKAILVGGGIGIPPMVELAKELEKMIGKENINCVAGYRDELFLTDELEKYSNLYIATEDGSTGTKGTVIDAINENGIEGDVIYACGPTPMLKALKEFATVECQLSLEERMACGIGACLACVCKTKEKDEHTNVNNKRICKEGPVVDARTIEL